LVASIQLDDFAPRSFRFAFRHSPQNWKRRFITGVAFQVGQVDEQIGLPLRRFGDGRSEIRSAATLEPEPAQRLRSFTTGKILCYVEYELSVSFAKVVTS